MRMEKVGGEEKVGEGNVGALSGAHYWKALVLARGRREMPTEFLRHPVDYRPCKGRSQYLAVWHLRQKGICNILRVILIYKLRYNSKLIFSYKFFSQYPLLCCKHLWCIGYE